MTTPRLSRPSLKISRSEAHNTAERFAFDVWSPFTGHYQAVSSLDDGLRRIEQMAGLIHEMWARKHPRQADLMDTPQPGVTDGGLWAEFRVNATTFRSYDTRRSGREMWLRANGGKDVVTEMICTSVGYVRMKAAS